MKYFTFATAALALAAGAALAQDSKATPAPPPAAGAGGPGADPQAALMKAAAGAGLTNATTLQCLFGCVGKAIVDVKCEKGFAEPQCFCTKQEWLDDTFKCLGGQKYCGLTETEFGGAVKLLNATCSDGGHTFNLTLPATSLPTAANGNATKGHTEPGSPANAPPKDSSKAPKPNSASSDVKQQKAAAAVVALATLAAAGLALL